MTLQTHAQRTEQKLKESLIAQFNAKDPSLFTLTGEQRSGDEIHGAFWHGYNGVTPLLVRGSLKYMAWKAGRSLQPATSK